MDHYQRRGEKNSLALREKRGDKFIRRAWEYFLEKRLTNDPSAYTRTKKGILSTERRGQ